MPLTDAEHKEQQLSLWDAERSEHSWSVRQSARARRLSVRVFRHGAVEIIVPPRTSPQRVSAFVSEHREWIERQRRRSAPASHWPMPPATLNLSALGEHWRCVSTAGSGRARVREMGTDQLLLRGHLDDVGQLRHVLRQWLGAHAEKEVREPLRGRA